jgi:hypothetical protein
MTMWKATLCALVLAAAAAAVLPSCVIGGDEPWDGEGAGDTETESAGGDGDGDSDTIDGMDEDGGTDAGTDAG